MSKRKVSFEPVEFKKETTVKGGLLSKPLTLPTLVVESGNANMEFVNLNKRQDWLCRMVSGQGSWGRPLNRVKLIETLQTRMKRALQNECVDDDATASDAEPSASIDDPMSNLAFEDAVIVANVIEEQKKNEESQ
jgi:hypothetical protein